MIDKELIKKRFQRSLPTYESNAIIQKKMAKTLTSLVDIKEFGSVLELGCGTGVLTRELANNIAIKHYDAVDIVEDCKNYLSDVSIGINFYVADIETFIPCKNYDLIVSNAALQWLDNLSEFLERMYLSLKPDGRFVFSVFGKENYKEFREFVKSPLNYVDKEELKKVCANYEIIRIEENIEPLYFKTPMEVLYHIRNTGVNAISKNRWGRSDLEKFINNYPKTGNGYSLTYNPIYVSLQKK